MYWCKSDIYLFSILGVCFMTRFIKNITAFAFPFILLLCLYILCDPFKVIWQYDNYHCNTGGALNRNFVSTMNYLNKKDKYHYDSFIFGNSRSLFYMIDDWKNYIPSESKCYHFSESGGSIHGVLYKLRLIDSLNENINNALFVIDIDLLNRINQEDEGIIAIMPPALIHNKNLLSFHRDFLIQWFNPRFFYYWMKFKLTGKFEQDMEQYIAKGTNHKYYNPITNEEPNHVQDSLIAIGAYYDKKRLAVFEDKQHPKVSKELLNDQEKIRSIKDMGLILAKHRTKYKIIISPLYNQVKISPKDLQFLRTVFGSDNVYDFSGVNKYTSDYHNYYEDSHYRKEIASDIMHYIYNH